LGAIKPYREKPGGRRDAKKAKNAQEKRLRTHEVTLPGDGIRELAVPLKRKFADRQRPDVRRKSKSLGGYDSWTLKKEEWCLALNNKKSRNPNVLKGGHLTYLSRVIGGVH